MFAVIATLTTLAACSSSTKSLSGRSMSGAPITTMVASATIGAARTCHPGPGYRAGTSIHHLVVAGVERTFLVHMPPHPTAAM